MWNVSNFHSGRSALENNLIPEFYCAYQILQTMTTRWPKWSFYDVIRSTVYVTRKFERFHKIHPSGIVLSYTLMHFLQVARPAECTFWKLAFNQRTSPKSNLSLNYFSESNFRSPIFTVAYLMQACVLPNSKFQKSKPDQKSGKWEVVRTIIFLYVLFSSINKLLLFIIQNIFLINYFNF